DCRSVRRGWLIRPQIEIDRPAWPLVREFNIRNSGWRAEHSDGVRVAASALNLLDQIGDQVFDRLNCGRCKDFLYPIQVCSRGCPTSPLWTIFSPAASRALISSAGERPPKPNNFIKTL